MDTKKCMKENDAGRIHLYGKDIQLQFSEDKSLSLDYLGDKDTNYLAPFIHGDVLWKAVFVKDDGTFPEYNSGNTAYKGHHFLENNAESGKVAFSWKIQFSNTRTGEFILYVEVDSRSTLTSWSCEIDMPSDWRVYSLECPILPNISYHSARKLITPSGWGISSAFQPGCLYEGKYPSWEASIQLLALLQEKKGLYFATHDTEAYLKTLRVQGKADKASISIELPLPLQKEKEGVFQLPFPVVIGIFEGDYVKAGEIYRDFTFEAPWGNAGSVDKRSDVPEWIKETCLWLRPDGSPEENVEVTEEALSYFDVPTALHWYRWHEIPYDTYYPEYFPPLPGFLDAIRRFQQKGARVLCYINSRLWDPDSSSWEEENAVESAAKNGDGTLYSEVYGSMIPNNVMCPATEKWQEKIASVVHTLVTDYELDGVYLDQIGAAPGVPCYAENHPHLPGGGNFWRRGYKKLLETVRRGMKETHILVTEENAECWLDSIDVHLNVNTPLKGGTPIPLYPVIYSDRAIIYGSFYFAGVEPAGEPLSFRLKHAWALLWGSQPGFIQPSRIMDPASCKEAEFLRNCVRIRNTCKKAMIGGRFRGMVKVDGSNPDICHDASAPFGGKWPIREKAVLAARWTSSEGKEFYLVTNISDQSHEVKLSLPAGLKSSGKCTLFSGADKKEYQKTADHPFFLKIQKRDVLLIEAE